MSDGPHHEPGETQPVPPSEGTRPLPPPSWSHGRPEYPYGGPPAPAHYPPGQYPATPYPGYGPAAESPRGQAVGALVTNIVLFLVTCGLGLFSLVGLILAAIAIGTADSDPQQARRLVRWAWRLAVTTGVIAALVVVGFSLLVVTSRS